MTASGPRDGRAPLGSAHGSQVFLSIGSNLGERLEQLKEAVARLGESVTNLRVSSVYETRPMYVEEQPAFLNIVVTGATKLSPEALLARCRGIEETMGRDRRGSVPKGPRIIDLDILLYDQEIVDTRQLQVPHPVMAERQFVLVPLLELAPRLRDPRTGNPFAESLARLEDQGVYILGPWEYTRGTSDRP